MTKEELLNKQTFINLFSIQNEIEKAEKEVELRQYADELKCKRDFNKLREFRSIDKVDNVKIPKVKMLNGTYVEYENYTKKEESNDPFKDFGDTVEITDDILD